MRRTYRRWFGGAAIDDDIISHGPDPGRGLWPRRLIVAAIAVLVIALLIVQHLPSGQTRQHAGSQTQRQTGRRHALHAVPGTIVIPAGQPEGIPGPTAPWSAALRLPVGSTRPAWLYPATGRMTPIRGLPPRRAGYVFTRIGGGWAVQPSSDSAPRCAGCAPRPLPVYFLADLAGSARLVGLADRVAPGARPGAMWLTSYPASPFGTPAAGFAQEFRGPTGKPLGPRLRLPAGYAIDAATDRGLLLTQVSSGGAAPGYELWDPVSGQVRRTFSAVIAADAGHVAWTPRCASRCLVRVLDLATGRTTRVTLPVGSAARGAFSPDGRLLALAVSIGNGGDGGATAIELEVASVPGGRLAIVPGTWASSDALSGFGWPASDDSLVAELSFVTKVQIASWQPGSSRLAVTVIGPWQNANDLVVG